MVAELMENPKTVLEGLRGLVVVDEAQREPRLFPVLRLLADRAENPATFLILGSASPELSRQSAESLAGRVEIIEMQGLNLSETGPDQADMLWQRGGFPRSFLATNYVDSFDWRRNFIRTFLERDLALLGFGMSPAVMGRFWTMLAHYHGQVWNGSELGRAFGVAHTTVRRYLDLLVETYMARVLPPWFENVGKRQVRAPKVYIEDTGLLHALLGIRDEEGLLSHPKVGASWEGFVLKEVVSRLGAVPEECFSWATHSGAELDLLVVRGTRRLGVEVKRTTAPALTRSMSTALTDLGLERVMVVHAGRTSFDLAPAVRAVAFKDLASDPALAAWR